MLAGFAWLAGADGWVGAGASREGFCRFGWRVCWLGVYGMGGLRDGVFRGLLAGLHPLFQVFTQALQVTACYHFEIQRLCQAFF